MPRSSPAAPPRCARHEDVVRRARPAAALAAAVPRPLKARRRLHHLGRAPRCLMRRLWPPQGPQRAHKVKHVRERPVAARRLRRLGRRRHRRAAPRRARRGLRGARARRLHHVEPGEGVVATCRSLRVGLLVVVAGRAAARSAAAARQQLLLPLEAHHLLRRRVAAAAPGRGRGRRRGRRRDAAVLVAPSPAKHLVWVESRPSPCEESFPYERPEP